MESSRPTAQDAFSLVELAVVLAILGLLTGGILGGQALLKSSEMNSVVGQAQGYVSAVNQFNTRFKALPGDMTNATNYWGLAGGTTAAADATCNAVDTTSTQATCNGNGDRISSYVSTAGNQYEIFRAWQHLANAGLVDGTYTGKRGGLSATDSVIGGNVPKTKRIGVGFGFDYWTTGMTNPVGQYSTPMGTMLYLGATPNDGATGIPPEMPAFTCEEGYSIDKKVDDGQPGTGNWLANSYNNTGTPWMPTNTNACTTSTATTQLTGTYRATVSTVAMSFNIKTGLGL